MGKMVFRPWWAVFDTLRITAAQIALEQFHVRTELKRAKRACINTRQAPDAACLINYDGTGLFINKHGLRHRAGLFAQRVFAVSADNNIPAGAVYTEPCQRGIDDSGF